MKSLRSINLLFQLLHLVLLLVSASNFAVSLPLENSGNVNTARTAEAIRKATSQADPIRSLVIGRGHESAETIMTPKDGFISSEPGLSRRWEGSRYADSELSFHRQTHGVYHPSVKAEVSKKYSSKSIERSKTSQKEKDKKRTYDQNIIADGANQNISKEEENQDIYSILGRNAEETLSRAAMNLMNVDIRDGENGIQMEGSRDPATGGFKKPASAIIRSVWQTEVRNGDPGIWGMEPHSGDTGKPATGAPGIDVHQGSERNSSRFHPEAKESSTDGDEEEEEFDSNQYEAAYIETGQDYGEDVEVIDQLLVKPDDSSQFKRRTDSSRKRKFVPTRKRTFRGPRPTSLRDRNHNNGGTKQKRIQNRDNLSSKSTSRLSSVSSYPRIPPGNNPSSSATRKQAEPDVFLGQFHASREEFRQVRSRSEPMQYPSIHFQGQNHQGIPLAVIGQFVQRNL